MIVVFPTCYKLQSMWENFFSCTSLLRNIVPCSSASTRVRHCRIRYFHRFRSECYLKCTNKHRCEHLLSERHFTRFHMGTICKKAVSGDHCLLRPNLSYVTISKILCVKNVEFMVRYHLLAFLCYMSLISRF